MTKQLYQNQIFHLFLLHNFILLCLKIVRLNSRRYFIMKILNKQELQQTAFNHLPDIDFKDFMNLSQKCTAKPYSSLVIDVTLASDNILHLERIFWKKYKN